MFRSLTRAALVLGVALAPANAETAPAAPPQTTDESPVVEDTSTGTEDAPISREQFFEFVARETKAERGPVTRDLGAHATVAVPEGLYFADAKGSHRLLELTGNVPSRRELGAVFTPDAGGWFVLFDFDASGYVSDEEKDELDADALLEVLQEGQEQGNEYRKQMQLEPLELVGWEKAPFYDPRTNNLTWATRVRSSSGGESINWEVRLLGREGVMSAQLVVAPADLQVTLAAFDALIAGFTYKDGKQYAQYVEGDHLAEYGLGGLVAGGGIFAAAKLGFFAKFGKWLVGAWKLVLLAAVGIGAGVKKFFGRVALGEKKPNESHRSG